MHIAKLENKRFGRLLVKKFIGFKGIGKTKTKSSLWLCKCDCGRIVEKTAARLSDGVKSCGCLVKEIAKNPKNIADLVGKKYFKLKVIKFKGFKKIDFGKKRTSIWLCKCDCGGYKITSTKFLQAGRIKSCGCLLKRKYKTNENYWNKIDTEDKAYFYGLMCTDGFVNSYPKKSKKYGIPRTFGIELEKKDKHILETFKKYLGTDRPLRKSRRIRPHQKKKGKFFKSETFILDVGIKSMSLDLAKIGIKVNKTHNLKFPSNKIIPHFLMRHCIRGIMDGDGSYHISKPREQPNITVTSASFRFLSGLKKYLKILKIENTDIKELKKPDGKQYNPRYNLFIRSGLTKGVVFKRKKNPGFQSGWSKLPKSKRYLNFKKFHKLIYNKCSKDLYLTRKRKKFDEIISL